MGSDLNQLWRDQRAVSAGAATAACAGRVPGRPANEGREAL